MLIEQILLPGLWEIGKGALGALGGVAANNFLNWIKDAVWKGGAAKGEFETLPPPAGSPVRVMGPFRPGGAAPGPIPMSTDYLSLASNVPGAWVPGPSEGICGINLTGVWGVVGDLGNITFIRQFGPFFNVIKPAMRNPPLYAEGVFNPATGYLFFTGQHVPGPPAGFEGYLHPNWTIGGTLVRMTPHGQVIPIPLNLMRFA